jgi:hypothetical protein
MGMYINYNSKGAQLPVLGKVKSLIEDGAKVIPFSELQIGDVVVVEELAWDAALYISDEQEFKMIQNRHINKLDNRVITYLHYPHAKKLAK